MRFLLFVCFCFFVTLGLPTLSYGKTLRTGNFISISENKNFQDTILRDTTATDSLIYRETPEKVVKIKASSLKPSKLALFPAVSLQQALKGESAGLYIQEPNGEPGTNQHMFIRGSSVPLLSAKELFQTQPLVILDGVPLTSEHPFALDIQQFKFNRIGPETNLLSIIDMDNLASVEVLKDIAAIAIYGPKAANGVILLKSKTSGTQRRINFDSYVGLAQKRPVTTINGKFENSFRKQFYDKYTANGTYSDNDVYPLYLSDSLNNDYYGPANWSDEYYNNGIAYSVNAGISGGTDNANFRFTLGNLRNSGVGDQTGADRYSTRFQINMKPMPWLTFSAMVNANRVERQRNKNVRDRLSQVNYIPDLSSPLTSNKESYSKYLAEFDKGFDDNRTNMVQGFVRIGIDLGKFNFNSTFGVDYNEGTRDIFFPRTLLQTTNYASNYFGLSQRLFFDNTASYSLKVNDDHDFNFTAGSSFHYDAYKYNYAYAYKGSNDFIKLNLLQSDPNRNDYLEPYVFNRFLVYKFLDKTRNNMVSFSGKVDYSFKEKYTFSALLRADGSSNQQPTSRWFYSPVLSAGWDIKKEFFEDNKLFSQLNLHVGAGRLGRHEYYDNYAQGPQYTASIGFTGNLIAPGYNGFATLTRPYSAGSVGYDLGWAYSDQLNVGVDAAFLSDRLYASIDLYSKDDKNQILGIPGAAEYGYTNVIRNGMAINNKGIDLTLRGIITSPAKTVSWTSSINVNYNKNNLKALPGGLSEIAIGDRLLKVGQAVDKYWLLTNDGIYNSDAEVPQSGTGQKLSYKGITLRGGDPKWRDLNGDNVINDRDKSLIGHSLPVISGGFNNDFGYKNWTLSMNLYYNLGRDLINQEMANRFDFVNREGLNNINSVKEITYWEKRGNYSNYPLYNPWSSSAPYQVNQDLFLENASFLKLRSISVGYDLTNIMKKKTPSISRFYIYGSANNVFTITKYTGQDPELVDFTGYDTGYGMQIPRTFTVGVKMEL